MTLRARTDKWMSCDGAKGCTAYFGQGAKESFEDFDKRARAGGWTPEGPLDMCPKHSRKNVKLGD